MIEFIKSFIAWYALIWALPGTIVGVVLALGTEERIAWLDKQLSKDAEKLHANYQCMTSYNIFSRYIDYCVTYPVIRHRSHDIPRTIGIFMWVNTIGIWSWIIGFISAVASKLL
ncbi:hypothetical protein Q5N41_17775 [Vibrio cholerae]|uniref:hypothetical protein n=1 Tax=Vibrio cholerae TaxID=666 RepID=UPI0000F34B25|nr:MULTISPECIES: hypothetical protein [Vibrio]EAZ74555.1 hypothetical protein A5C_A0384 [Vibrio cholerae NCTC 8457]EGR1102492.1 hypothetical protein [Vibrio cholerae]EGR4455530.1 hypothetical protein [Vibrio cholerae]ELH0879146.1 hypothetical protein [Vibrio cholerae]ELL7182926.1 hypothetical protein [Vibrio cholerae]